MDNNNKNIKAIDIIQDAMKNGSLKDSVMSHSATYGIEQISQLFPDAKLVKEPTFINNPVEWVNDVLTSVHKVPFSRIKSMFVDVTDSALRAKGYVKGNLKKEDVISLLKRTTGPTTIYKKQRLDRDDIIDITDFAAVEWLKREMRLKLDEELARSILFGDGRELEDEDKIDDTCIRPIIDDEDLYAIKVAIDTTSEGYNVYEELHKAVIRSRKLYRGSGKPALFVSEDTVSELLLLETPMGEKVFKTVDDIAKQFRVNKVVTINEMEGLVRNANDEKTHNVLAIIVNLTDYTVGANKGGAVSMFDDFDIDYNQQKYLIETRCSGALTVPYSAMIIEEVINTPVAQAEYDLDENEDDVE